MNRPRIYVSGAITFGDGLENFHRFGVAYKALIDGGFAPWNPGLTMLFPGNHNIAHHVWLEIDIPWVSVAHAVLRLPGESAGADEECGHARSLGIPVFDSMEELNKYFWSRKPAVA